MMKYLINIFLFILVLLSGSVSSTNEIDIDLVIFNHTISWGSCPSGEGGHSDFYSSSKFSLGIANNGSQTFKIEEIILNFTILGTECVASTQQQQIKEDGLPVSLSPNSYMIVNITCPSNNIRIRIVLIVDQTAIDVGEVIAYGQVNKVYVHWDEWKDYIFYTSPHEVNFPSFYLSEFLIILFFFSRILKKQ